CICITLIARTHISILSPLPFSNFFLFTDPAPTDLYPLSLHDALPISSNSAKVKIRAVESYGAHIVLCEPTEAAREATCAEVIKKTGATPIHSFENENVIAGQGTAVLEFLEDVPDLDLVMCPVGGGGLLSGTAVAAK